MTTVHDELKGEPHSRRAGVAVTLSTMICAMFWPFFLVYPVAFLASLVAPTWTLKRLEMLTNHLSEPVVLNPPESHRQTSNRRIRK